MLTAAERSVMDDRAMTLPGDDGTGPTRAPRRIGKIEAEQQDQDEYTYSCVHFTLLAAPSRSLKKLLCYTGAVVITWQTKIKMVTEIFGL
jgi:hypothetical protein